MPPTVGERIIGWALNEPTVELLVLIGSHTRAPHEPGAADSYSDWDFQIATSATETFATARWVEALQGPLVHYVFRPGRLGSAQKVTALFTDGELDLVVIPAPALRGMDRLVKVRQHATNPAVGSALTDLAAVLQGGYRILKGADDFAELYRFVATEISPARLSNDNVCHLADGFVCDYVSTVRKIERGEVLAAQRWLHVQLGEVNFKLLHELRLREGKVSFPDARRLEKLVDARVAAVTVETTLDPTSLRGAVEKAATTLRALTEALVGADWHWPRSLS